MNEQGAIAENMLHLRTQIACELLQGRQNPLAWIAGYTWYFYNEAGARTIRQNQVSEGAADIDTYPPRCV